MNDPQKGGRLSGADRDATSEELAREVLQEQADDLFTDRGAINVSSPQGDGAAENKVATSLDDE